MSKPSSTKPSKKTSTMSDKPKQTSIATANTVNKYRKRFISLTDGQKKGSTHGSSSSHSVTSNSHSASSNKNGENTAQGSRPTLLTNRSKITKKVAKVLLNADKIIHPAPPATEFPAPPSSDSLPVKGIEAVFRIFDCDSDGSISRAEVGTALKQCEVNFNEEQLTAFMQKLDKDGDGDIDYEEFCGIMRDVVSMVTERERQMKDAFTALDINGDGSITQKELESAIVRLGGQMTQKESDDIMKMADKDGDGEIDYEEFVTLLQLLDLYPK